MDNVKNLGVDDSLVPPVYEAWAMWHEGNRSAAIDALRQVLANQFGDDVLGGAERLLSRAANGYQDLFALVFSEPYALSAAPAEVAASIWRQAPRDAMLRAIFLGDYRWSDDPFGDSPSDVPGAQVLIGILRLHETAGLLSRDANDVPFGGRPVLTQELLAVADRLKLGPVYGAMLEPVRGPNLPDAWWASASADMPKLVMRTFVHDAFVAEDGRPGRPAHTWNIIRDRHPSYASAVLTAWAALKDSVSAEEWARVARFVARAPHQIMQDRLADVLND